MPIKYDKNGKLKTVNRKTITTFQADYSAKLRKHYMEGKATVQFCRDIGIGRRTFDDWVDKYPEFKKAKEDGRVFAEAAWLDKADCYVISHYEGEQLDTNLYKFIVAGRFGHRNKIKSKIPKLDPNRLMESMQILMSAWSEGKIDKEEYIALTDSLMKAATLQQHEVMAKDVEDLKKLAYKNKSERIGETEGEL